MHFNIQPIRHLIVHHVVTLDLRLLRHQLLAFEFEAENECRLLTINENVVAFTLIPLGPPPPPHQSLEHTRLNKQWAINSIIHSTKSFKNAPWGSDRPQRQWVVKEKKGVRWGFKGRMRVVSVEVRSGGGLDRKF